MSSASKNNTATTTTTSSNNSNCSNNTNSNNSNNNQNPLANPTPQANSYQPQTQQRKKKRPHERQLPQVLSHLPESRLYFQLQEQERKLDALLIRKRLDIQEALTRPLKQKKTLRIYMSNLAANQSWEPEKDGRDSPIPSWTLRIEGRLLQEGSKSGPKSAVRKFSSFLKSMVVELDRDRDLYPEGNTVEWIKTQGAPETDGFEIKRSGDQNVNCKVALHLDYSPEKFKLSEALRQALNVTLETKASIIMAVWQYIKIHRLQDTNDHRLVRCDPVFQAVFQVPQFYFPQLPELLAPHLCPADPIIIDYEVCVDEERHVWDYVLDVEVEVDDGKEIGMLDQQVAMVHQIQNHVLKRDFMLSFTMDPVGFINKWVAAQARDLELVLGENQVNMEAQRRSEFYRDNWVPEAVFHYLATRASAHLHACAAV